MNQLPQSIYNSTDTTLLNAVFAATQKANSIPEGSRTGFRAGPEQQSERSDAGLLIVQEVFGLVKETDVPEGSGAKRRQATRS